MISENQKISQRQFGRMVVMDWLAKAALLLPGFAENESGRSFILSLIAGVSLAVAYEIGRASCRERVLRLV